VVDDKTDNSGQSTTIDESTRNFLEVEIARLVEEAQESLERVRAGEQAALAELKQFWGRLKSAGGAYGVPTITVLGSAFEALGEAWQRARVGGREHPDAPRLTQEALDLLPALARGEVPRGSGVLKDLCVRAADLTLALARVVREPGA